MAIKGILFNTDMVRAILDGRKKVTRRVIKYPPHPDMPENHNYCRMPYWTKDGCRTLHYMDIIEQNLFKQTRYFESFAPYEKGDILYVRETWNYGYFDSSDMEGDNSSWFEEFHKADGKFLKAISHYIYRADYTEQEEYEFGTEDENGKRIKIPWKPSLHMPKEAARIWLKVTDVRVERLQDITITGLQKEGILTDGYCSQYAVMTEGQKYFEVFKEVWNSTIKKKDLPLYGWNASPWVWVIEFERCEKLQEV